jgi:hypothetical protein
MDYQRYTELTAGIKVVDQSVVDNLARDINRGWWEQNRFKFENVHDVDNLSLNVLFPLWTYGIFKINKNQ